LARGNRAFPGQARAVEFRIQPGPEVRCHLVVEAVR